MTLAKVAISVLALCLAVACSDTVSQAERLGSERFDPQRWAAGTPVERGRMVGSFLQTHEVRSMTAEQVHKLLGSNTGYLHYESEPTYLVGAPNTAGGYADGFLLVFATDKSTPEQRVIGVIFAPEITPDALRPRRR
ncbi:hypothetical protein E4L96_16205 [Massilia arenosa]|uniref:Uncharacterized protein n=1 Tax=Zemynaea arenosa TaxID=2561931 RepID=A0A4Y9SAE0_9BURK|nr:hypothetical protein [Massilia arenosa]TFW16538.1 hypothetical protein E4L96_16205 [Massilia arenosa]